jgi:hypothetical protein
MPFFELANSGERVLLYVKSDSAIEHVAPVHSGDE